MFHNWYMYTLLPIATLDTAPTGQQAEDKNTRSVSRMPYATSFYTVSRGNAGNVTARCLLVLILSLD
ncbi:hypothetical protein Y1Q_0005014 [Alligator mississippiensis]|uniref:Uncharacterized protein n=1 Tax=Alligator mississippiensis TaxID=8496 RepID=A0A151MLE0_ALLMI|nr:hypothetical protein Y1Q_0005014 [Alligator mississippiensis]